MSIMLQCSSQNQVNGVVQKHNKEIFYEFEIVTDDIYEYTFTTITALMSHYRCWSHSTSRFVQTMKGSFRLGVGYELEGGCLSGLVQ